MLHRLRGLPANERSRNQGAFTRELLMKPLAVDTRYGAIQFVLLSETAAGRALGLLQKQPGTIEWIDSFEPNSVFWDIGANIGVYTLYAARRGDIRVAAFEPAAVNYFMLAANCEVNRFEDRVDCLLAGLSNERALARLGVSQFAPGDSFSFREKKGREEPSRQAALVVTMDQLITDYGLPCPNYIKIDVPSLTEKIVAGGQELLRKPDVRALHIETKEETQSGRNIAAMLKEAGFLPSTRHTHRSTTDVTFTRAPIHR